MEFSEPTLEEIPDDDLFEVRPAGGWFKDLPAEDPKMLFGDLWFEGEVAVMYGESSVGKSILAVQIADAIARGGSIGPMENTSSAQTVVYLDLARTGEQFARRYSSEPDEKGMRTVHEFPAELLRPNLKHNVHLPVAKLAGLVKQTGAKVLIIDNLAFMQKYSLPRETAVVMRELRKIRDRFGLSILLLMNGPRAVRYRGIVAADIPCSTVVTSFADNVFAIGRSGSRSNERYIKHLKPGFEDLSYGEAHVPTFEIGVVNGNFPAFTHKGYTSEPAIRANDNDEWEWNLVRKIKELSDSGMSIRAIAQHMEMPRSTVHRRLLMAIAAPPLPEPEPESYFASEAKQTKSIYWFPGREEYSDRMDELFQQGIMDRSDPEAMLRNRESHILEYARIRAREAYLKTGKALRPVENPEYAAFMEALHAFRESGESTIPRELLDWQPP